MKKLHKRKWPLITMSLVVVAVTGTGIALYLGNQRIAKSDEAEKRFIEQMIPHHESAVQMAGQAKGQAVHEETRTLAAKIIAAQQQEIYQMMRWYKEWWGVEPPKARADPHAGHGGEPEGGATTFDEGFVSMMIPHHEAAVKMAEITLPLARHKEIRDLAVAIVAGQRVEIETMRQLQRRWRAVADKGGPGRTVTITYTENGFDKPNLTIKKGTTVKFVSKRKDQPMYVASDPHPEHTLHQDFEQSYVNSDFPSIGQGMMYTFAKAGRWPYHDHNDMSHTGVIVVED